MYEWELLWGEQALILFNCHLLSPAFTISAACWLSLVFTEEQDKALSVSSENIAAFLMRSKCKEKKYLCPQLFGGEVCKSLQKPRFPLFKFYRGRRKTNSGGTNLISLKPFYLSTHYDAFRASSCPAGNSKRVREEFTCRGNANCKL